MANSTPWAIISGAGPSGLLLALMLGQKGVHVHLLEKGIEIDLRPRATHYAPSAVHELQRAGIADEARARGFTPKEICWRKLDGTYLAGIDQRLLSTQESERMICLPLDKLGTLLLERIKEQPTISLKYRHRIIDVGQNAEVAWVDVETPEGKKRLEANYIIGCDGASSQIRRSLFSEFPGKTWEQQIVATNVYYPFEKWDYLDANFFIHPEHWHMVARISTDGMWRVSYGEIPGLSDEELIARQPMKFQKMFPGHPTADSGEYRLTNISPYKVHQRLAERMRVGRILLAADAAHLCNPFGGMGLTGGIVDIGGLYDCLIGVYEGKADDSILDKYDEVRRRIYEEVINPVSSGNIVRLFGQDPDKALENDDFLKLLVAAKKDEKALQVLQDGMSGIMHDFTKYYNRPNKTPEKSQAEATASEQQAAVVV